MPVLHGADLNIDRLFATPALSGPCIVGLQISPDDSRVTYLRSNPADRDRLDLWEYNIHENQARVLVDSLLLDTPELQLSAEESSRRERHRTASLSGIVEYSFAPTGNTLLFSCAGELYLFDFARPTHDALTKINQSQGFITDAKISPNGRYVTYVREQNLYAYDLERHHEWALTHDGCGPIKNGMAEFVAQEEMGRATGYWWSPDDLHIAFARVDETSVQVTQRFEITSDNVTTFAQRYPAAGGANVRVRLGIYSLVADTTTWIDLGEEQDNYLARVNWLPNGETLAIQRQSRDQRRLDLLFADISDGKTRIIVSETSDTWIELHDELTFLKQTPEFVWASSRDGYPHLYLYDYEGYLIRQLTAGEWAVNDFRGRAIKAVDEKNRLIYFIATEKSALERHLYSTSLDTLNAQALQRISAQAGLHSVAMSTAAQFYVDTFTSPAQPPQVSLCACDGSLIAYLLENPLDESHPDAPYVLDNSVAEFGTLNAADGQVLHFRLFKPLGFDANTRYPVIVDVYGGPGVQRVVADWNGSSFTQLLTRAGYVVFQLDNRGSAFRGAAFQDSIHRRFGDIEVADQVQGALWLRAQPFIDGARIGVWGWSYGGYLTLMLMFKAPDLFRAGVSGAPVTDWILYDTHYTERYLAKPQDNAVGYHESSVLPHAHKLRGELLIIHGMADDNVLFLHSTKLFRKLQDIGKNFDVMVYPGAKHGLLRQQDGKHALSKTLNFFRRHLMP